MLPGRGVGIRIGEMTGIGQITEGDTGDKCASSHREPGVGLRDREGR